MNRPVWFATLACFLCLSQWMTADVRADNWAHWRGPTGNGVAPDANPPVEFDSRKNVKWKVKIPGRSSGSPVVWEDRVFVVTSEPASNANRSGGLPRLSFKVLCFDRGTGNLVWDAVATTSTPHEPTHATNSFASASPCTDGEHVYAHFGSRGLYCYTMDGKLVWKRDDFGKMRTRNSFGEGSSPTIEGEMTLLPWDHEGDSALYALDKRTGKTIWKTGRDEPTGWATPLVVPSDGKKQVIMNGENSARSYDLETGKELWWCAGQTQRPAASPVYADGIVYIGSGFRGAFLGAFELDGRGDIEGTRNVVWHLDRDTPDIASPLLSSGRIYFYKGKSGLLSCADAKTGKLFYSTQRLPGLQNIYASPIAAGGYVYLFDRNGSVVVIEDSPTLKVVATSSMGETVDATPAIVDNEMFIRGEEHLFCIAK